MLSELEIRQLIQDFLDVCSINNPSCGEREVAEWLINRIKDLSVVPLLDEHNNLFFHVPGEGEPVFLNAHLDSVQPCKNKEPQFDGNYFSSKGNTVLGADDLEGVITILHALFYIKKNNIPHKPIDVLFTAMEEIGGKGVKEFDFKKFTAKKGLVVDSKAPVGSIVIKSPSKINFSLFAKGKAAHGSKISEGLSAIVMISEVITELPIGAIDEKTFLNIGKLEAGKSINSVPSEALLEGKIKIYSEGEIRGEASRAKKIIQTIEKVIKKVEKKYKQGKISFKYEIVREAYNFSKDDIHILEIQSAIKSIGLKPKYIESLGVSDANTFNGKGLHGVLIGTGVKDLHTTKERVDLESMKKLIELIVTYCSL